MSYLIRTALFVFLMAFSASAASYEKLDLDTNGLLIQKLEKALSLTGDETVKYKILLIRLGDAYSERARLHFLNEAKKKNPTYGRVKSDRKKAIGYYERALGYKNTAIDRVKIHYQIGHLSQQNEDTLQAKRSFSVVTKIQKTGKLPSLAFTALGDIYYSERKFRSALVMYNSALKTKNPPREGYLVHRKAWSHYALGQNSSALRLIKLILKTPKLLANQDGKIDPIFHSEVAHDHVRFLAKSPVTSSVVKSVVELTPTRDLKSVLFDFSKETQRLDQHKSTLAIIKAIPGAVKLDGVETAELLIQQALLNFNLNYFKSAERDYAKALKIWKEEDCDEEKCGNLKVEIRNLLVHWQKKDQFRPNLQLLGAYEAYLEVFKTDSDFYLFAGLLASKLNMHSKALRLHKNGVIYGQDKKDREGNLVAILELAEKTNKTSDKLSAYDFFIENSQNKNEIENVTFLKAKELFNSGMKKESLELDRKLLSSKLLDQKLQVASANRYLDALTKTGDHQLLFSESKRLTKLFPQQRESYASINRVAALKLAAVTNKNRDASNKERLNSQRTLLAADRYKATEEENLKIDKAALVLAISRKALSDVVRISSKVLSNKELRSTEKDEVLLDLAWAHEMQVDFKSAYKTLLQVKRPRTAKSRWELKMGLLAELSGLPYGDHYRAFIKHTRSRREANLIRAKLIRENGVTWEELDEEKDALLYSPELLSELVLEAYSRRTYRERAEPYIKFKKVRSTPHGSAVYRHLAMLDILRAARKVERNRFRVSSQYLITQSTLKRSELLSELEAAVDKGVTMNDWVMLAAGFATLAKEYDRYINDLEKAPLPSGMNKKEKARYLNDFKKGLHPIKVKQRVFAQKADEFWSQGRSVNNYTNFLTQSESSTRKLLKREAHFLSKVSPDRSSSKKIIKAHNSKGPRRISIASVSDAWKEIKKDPFDLDKLEDLKDLESQRGSDSVVSYIDLRMQTIKGGS